MNIGTKTREKERAVDEKNLDGTQEPTAFSKALVASLPTTHVPRDNSTV